MDMTRGLSWLSSLTSRKAAPAAGHLNPTLPPEVVLYTLFARACDPVLSVLKASGQHSDADIIDMLLTTCFDGLRQR